MSLPSGTSQRNPVLRFITRHALAIFYVLGFAVIVAVLFTVNRMFWSDFDYNWRDIVDAPQLLGIRLNNIADALILMLPLLLLPARRRGLWQWIVLGLIAFWGGAQVLYHPNYLDIMPYSSFLLVQNLGTVTVKAAMGSFRMGQLHIVFWPVLLLVFYLIFLRKGVKQNVLRHRWLWVGLSVLLFAAIRLYNPVCTFYDSERVGYGEKLKECYTVTKGHNDLYFKHNGFVSYTVYSAVKALDELRGVSKADKARVDEFIAGNPNYSDNNHASGKQNLILIIVESLNSWVVDLRIDGREVTPNLNRLCADTTNLVGIHMKSQAKNGHSSDGQFMYVTGILPLMGPSVAMSYGEADYPSLVKALKGYNSLIITNDYEAMWNLGTTRKSYGFAQLHDKDSLYDYYEANGFNADRTMFKYAAQMLPRQRQPFFAQMVTIDMHSPFNSPRVDTTWISQSKQYTAAVRNYLELTAYFDRQLGEFLDSIAACGLLGNSTVVIVSDHCERVDNEPAGRPSISPDGDDCLMVVLNPGEGNGGRKENVFGQIDIYPTLLDLMGANAYAWKGVGNSLLRTAVNSSATDPDNLAGDKASPLAKRQQEAWDISRIMITGRYLPAAK